MAKFIGTTPTNYHLEKMIKEAKDRLILISPYLKFSDKIKELLEEKDRDQKNVIIVFGKQELQQEEAEWLNKMENIQTRYIKNLHAKCYLNENSCIITSLNLYLFSQINNDEMGVFVSNGNNASEDDKKLYEDVYSEAERIIKKSERLEIIVKKIEDKPFKPTNNKLSKLTTSKLAKELQITTKELNGRLVKNGFIKIIDNKEELTEKGKQAGGVAKTNEHGSYFLWNSDLKI
ncbi:MAG: DNA repair protein [Gammaproteobacteria bacterium]|nr:MAG: DNA repair protein [Gammaproteobacteria bacterium]